VFGIGSGELLIIVGVAFLLFGPALLAFWFGYVMGTKHVVSAPSEAAETVSEAREVEQAGEPPTGAREDSADG
jgi:hypothetical protein